MTSKLETWAQTALVVIGRSGDEIIAECPWCSRPKLWLNVEKRQFICYRGCASGTAISLVRHVDGVTRDKARQRIQDIRRGEDLAEAVDSLGRRVRSVDPDPIDVDLPDGYVPCFNGALWRVPRYASDPPPEGRGLSDADLVRHGIGYVGSGNRTKWRSRLVVPVVYRGNRTFVARLMGRARDYRWTSKTGEVVTPRRYLYPKGSHTGRLLYWGDQIPSGANLIVVEGVFDAIRLISLGLDAVATFGKQLTPAQASQIAELEPRSVTMAYDVDAQADAVRAALRLSERITDVFVAPVEDDPDELGYYEGLQGVEDVLTKRWRPKSELDALELELSEISA